MWGICLITSKRAAAKRPRATDATDATTTNTTIPVNLGWDDLFLSQSVAASVLESICCFRLWWRVLVNQSRQQRNSDDVKGGWGNMHPVREIRVLKAITKHWIEAIISKKLNLKELFLNSWV